MKAEWMPVAGSMENFKKELKQLQLEENGIHLVFYLTEEKELFFVHCQKTPFLSEHISEKHLEGYRLAEVQLAGEDQDDHHGSKYTGTMPGKRLRFQQLLDERNEWGRRITIEQKDEKTGLIHRSIFQFFDAIGVLESWSEVENTGEDTLGMTYLSSFSLNGLTKSADASWDRSARLSVPSNSWYGEFQWKTNSLPELGMYKVFHYSTKRLSYSATGTWNSHEYLPMGFVSNTETSEGWFFSIIHNGSWHWEVGDSRDQLYLQLSGPTESENHWYEELKPGETFESVHAAVAVTDQGFEDAVWQMTAWRRKVRLVHSDHEKLPVIFNDFMNCLGGDPNEEKELPLIDAAAEIGCEYYTIDAGWYAQGSWWSRVGEWEPAPARWPNGIGKVLSYIREKGMIPGLWLELEVMGIHCPIAAELPDDWFFLRHGKRVIDHGRYQLDFRNPAVREFADGVIKRVVEDYGAGYIKMDYNINAGIGTEHKADSPGAGLLEHNRAYLNWLDETFKKYPELIIENCGSGGMRMNDALLSRHSIQSSSDQTEYVRYAAISAAAPAALTPEQNAVWSYPLFDADGEQTVFNMINAMTMRIHQSGHLARLSDENRKLIQTGIDYYKSFRHLIPQSLPFWPLGLPAFNDQKFALGFFHEDCSHLAVWNVEEEEEEKEGLIELSLKAIPKEIRKVELVYPAGFSCKWEYCSKSKILKVCQPAYSARLFKITY